MYRPKNNPYKSLSVILEEEIGLQRKLARMDYQDGKLSSSDFEEFNRRIEVFLEMCEWANIDPKRFNEPLGFHCSLIGSYSPSSLPPRKPRELSYLEETIPL